jgi:hypothetical protein
MHERACCRVNPATAILGIAWGSGEGRRRVLTSPVTAPRRTYSVRALTVAPRWSWLGVPRLSDALQTLRARGDANLAVLKGCEHERSHPVLQLLDLGLQGLLHLSRECHHHAFLSEISAIGSSWSGRADRE